jgi:hypothetical protein
MTGLAESARKGDLPELREVSYAYPTPDSGWDGRRPRRFGSTGGWSVVGWVAAGLAGSLAIAWYIFFGPGETGSKAEWFFGAVVFCVVVVSMWQLVTIQRHARQDAAEAEERHREALAAAEERAMRELAMTQRLHRTQIEAQQRLHDAEMQAQRELVRTERTHLVNQLQKQAMIEVSRAVNAHTHMLATLWNQAASVLRIEDADDRQNAMNPIFEQISRVVNDFSIELRNAYLVIEDDDLQHALDQINEAALMAIRVAEEVNVAVIEGHPPQANPIPPVQRLLHTRAAEARSLAWSLLRTGLDDSGGRTE